MLVELEKFIFPDTCEVFKHWDSQSYIFPIFKNGSSSLRHTCTVVSYEELATITEPIIVFLRDPKDRYASGINTYVHHLRRDNPQLDYNTILFFVENYLFLNNHYSPQFFWLLNLARFTNTKIDLKHWNDIRDFTPYHSKAGIEKVDNTICELVNNSKKLELYCYLDEQLLNNIGKQMTVSEIVNEVKQKHPDLFEVVFGQTQRLHNVLS